MTNKESIPQVDLIPAQSHSSVGPGMRLREAREQAKITISEVANQLHLTSKYVEAMETDDYVATPNRVFVRGYLRSYAKFLNLPPDEILAEFDALGVVDKQAVSSTIVLTAPSRGSLEHFTPWIIGVFLIGMGLLLFLWWRSQHSSVENNSFSTLSQDKATNAAALPTIPFTPKFNKLAMPPAAPVKLTPNNTIASPASVSNPLMQNQHSKQFNSSSPALTAQPAPVAAPTIAAPAITNPAVSAGQHTGQSTSPPENQGSANYNPTQLPISGPSAARPLPVPSTVNPAVFPLHNVPNANNSNSSDDANGSDSSKKAASSAASAQPELKNLKKAGSYKQQNKLGGAANSPAKKRHIQIDSPF